MNNLPYVSSKSYAPPNDNSLIDDYGNTKVSINVPVNFPKENQSMEANPPTKFVWAGNEYVVKSITRDQVSAAFNLPNDIQDAALTRNKDYVPVAPHFSVNIEAHTTSSQRSSSTIASLAIQTLRIIIPVYKQSDFNRMNNTNVQSYEYKGDSNTFQNIHEFMKVGSELYGVILQDERSEIQIVPKKVCVVSDEFASTIRSHTWKHTCSSRMNTDILCRMKNTNEITGYSQGIVKYIQNKSIIPTNILTFKTIGFASDPISDTPISHVEKNEIPVEIEGEGSDGTTQKFRIVVDEGEESIGVTNSAIVLFSAIVIGIALFVITSLSESTSGYSYYVPRMVLILLSGITLPVIYSSKPDDSPLKTSSIWLVLIFMLIIFGIMMYNLASSSFLSIPKMSAGVTVSVLLLMFSIISFVYSMILNYGNDKTDKDNAKRNLQVGNLLSYVPKLFVIVMLFLTNPAKNIMSISTFTDFKSMNITSLDVSKGIEKIMNNDDNFDVTDTDIANAIKFLQKREIDGDPNVLVTNVKEDRLYRVYHQKQTDDKLVVKGSIYKKDDNGDIVPDTTYTQLDDDYSPVNNTTWGNNVMDMSNVLIVGLLVFALCLIFLQPTPLPNSKDDTHKWTEFWMSLSVHVIILLAIVYLWMRNTFGNLVGLALILSIFGNIGFKVGLILQDSK